MPLIVLANAGVPLTCLPRRLHRRSPWGVQLDYYWASLWESLAYPASPSAWAPRTRLPVPLLVAEAKIGILAGSLASGLLGYTVLRFAHGERCQPTQQGI